MKEFKEFLLKLNAVKSSTSEEIQWLQDIEHYDFINEAPEQQALYLGFVSNLIVSYYELLLEPFIDKNAKAKVKVETREHNALSEAVEKLLKDIVLSDVWKVTSAEHISVYNKNLVKDLILIGLLVVTNRYQLFESFKAILSTLSGLEIVVKSDLFSLYEQLAVKYESSDEEEQEEVIEIVDLEKILPFLSFELELMNKKSDELQDLLKQLGMGHHRHNSLVDLEKIQVFEVRNDEREVNFNPNHLETNLYVHGTNNQNILSILEQGIEANPKYIATGSSLGKGAYFAQLTEVGKSVQYASNYLFIVEVATGKQLYTSHRRDYREEILSSECLYDSLHFQGYTYDEIVIYRKEQLLVKYLIKL